MPSSSEIRQQFLDFFVKKHGHAFVPSSPVVPHDDPTLLFANAGMNQFKPYFLGTEKPKSTRVANTQKCIRAGGKHNDLDDVGKDTYHHTFFEMLGNWSFGDYFKKDAIAWAWELLTDVWKLDKTRLHVTVFEGDPANGIPRDDEAAGFWKAVGVADDHIHLGNKKDNFWEMGETGPCGPCTEIHYDKTPDKSGAKLVNGGSDQCIEIWNNVFIQFNRNADRSLTPLPAQHVDTGMGFERIVAVLNGRASNYDTDVFAPLFEAIREATGARPYGGKLEDLTDTAYRVIGDHIRTLTFALTDGATPGNKGRGAVLRSVLRRASRYGWQVFGKKEPFLFALVDAVVANFGSAFPELKLNPAKVKATIKEEEVSFLRTLEKGLKLFQEAAVKGSISAKDAFELHTTYGLDIGITTQMAAEAGLTVDRAGYDKLFEEFQKESGKNRAKTVISAIQGTLPKTDDSGKYHFFVGVPPLGGLKNEDRLKAGLQRSKILGWIDDNRVVSSGSLAPGKYVSLLLDRTSFYGEQGGQVGDTGTLTTDDGAEFEVEDTNRLGESVLHMGTLQQGVLSVGDSVSLKLGATRHSDIQRHHTGTHLMNLALRQTLGDHVDQKGSLVDDAKTRFDFTHDKPLTPDELRKIERDVNLAITNDLPVNAIEMPLAEAKALPGVRAVFGEKYPDPVRVVVIGEETPAELTGAQSVEFCGGTHVPSTGSLGYFRIVSQEGVAKGVRRITAVTGRAAAEALAKTTQTVDDLAAKLQCPPEELPRRVGDLQEELKTLKAALAKSRAAELAKAVDALADAAPILGAAKVIVGQLPETTVDAVRAQIDRLRQTHPSAFIVLAWIAEDGKVPVLAALTNDLVAKGLKAGEIVKPVAAILGGTGGGKPDLAQAGGKDAAKIDEALAKARELASEKLQGKI